MSKAYIKQKKSNVILLQRFHLLNLRWVFDMMLLKCHHLGEKLVAPN